MMRTDRARGCLLGLACGDAIGATREFENAATAGRKQTDMVGGGPFRLAPGQVTDDTQMAVCLAESLAACDGYNPDDAAQRYLAWSRVAFDVGTTTRTGLAQFACGVGAAHSGRVAARLLGAECCAGNGALMRVAPIAVWHAHQHLIHLAGRQAAVRDAALDALITHGAPECVLANAALVGALFHALTQERATGVSTLDAARATLCRCTQHGDEEVIACGDLLYDLDLAQKRRATIGQGGYVRDTFQFAFWLLLHAENYRDCVLRATNHGGDTDTNAAVAGALWGAVHGADDIPDAWQEKVAVACSGDPLWGDEYHPSRLMVLSAV